LHTHFAHLPLPLTHRPTQRQKQKSKISQRFMENFSELLPETKITLPIFEPIKNNILSETNA